MMNKIMLIYPPGRLFQRGEDRAQCNVNDSVTVTVHACNDLGYCAAILRDEYEVFLRDYQTEKADEEQLKSDILHFSPDLIFISTTNATIFEDLQIVENICCYYECEFVLKGALFYDVDTVLLSQLNLSHISCLIGGETEFIIKPLADALLKKEEKLKDIPGIIYSENGVWKKTAFHCWNEDLDSLPFPARDLMNNALYVRPDTNMPMATISVARGCPSSCMYCLTPHITGKKVRFRSVENVFREIEECYYTYGIKSFFFKADTFTINQKWAIELCDKIIQSSLQIEFTCNSRADTVSAELLQKIKEAGCFMFAIGFESGSDKTLKFLKKGTSVQKNLDAAKLVKQAGLPLFGFFMMGMPWEDREALELTVKHIFDINPDFIEISIAMPYYGTQLYDLCLESGTIDGKSFGFDTMLSNIKGTRYLSFKQVQRIKRNCLLRFYLRPCFIFKKMIASVKQPVVLKNYIKYGFHLLRQCIH